MKLYFPSSYRENLQNLLLFKNSDAPTKNTPPTIQKFTDFWMVLNGNPFQLWQVTFNFFTPARHALAFQKKKNLKWIWNEKIVELMKEDCWWCSCIWQLVLFYQSLQFTLFGVFCFLSFSCLESCVHNFVYLKPKEPPRHTAVNSDFFVRLFLPFSPPLYCGMHFIKVVLHLDMLVIWLRLWLVGFFPYRLCMWLARAEA